mgnify:CR=1 FL=1
MRNIRKVGCGMNITLDSNFKKRLLPMGMKQQPFQIDLFTASTDGNAGYSNLLNFWDQVPLYFSDRNNSTNTRTLDFLVKNGKIQEQWRMQASPAQFLSGSHQAEIIRFPGRLEELVMASLIDIAASEAVMVGENIGVPCYLGDLMRTMSSNGRARCSYSELNQAIQVLNKAKYTLIGPTNQGKRLQWDFSQISEMVSHQDESAPQDSRILFIFNRLLTKQILELQLRLYNFDRFKKFNSSASRPVYKRLCLRFLQAATDESYTIALSTVRVLAGLSTPDDMSIAKRRKPVISCFEELIKEGVLVRYELTDTTKERMTTGMRRKLRTIDEIYKLYPTQRFADEQKKASAIINDIRTKWETAQSLDASKLTDSERTLILNKMPICR